MVHSLPPIPVSLLKRFDPSTAMFLAYGNAMTGASENGWFSMDDDFDNPNDLVNPNDLELTGSVTWRDIGVKSEGAALKIVDSLSRLSVLETGSFKYAGLIEPIVLHRTEPLICEISSFSIMGDRLLPKKTELIRTVNLYRINPLMYKRLLRGAIKDAPSMR